MGPVFLSFDVIQLPNTLGSSWRCIVYDRSNMIIIFFFYVKILPLISRCNKNMEKKKT